VGQDDERAGDEPRLPALPDTRRRRRPDASAALEILFAVPSFLSSLFVMALVGYLITPGITWLIPALWLLSGAIVFIPVVDTVLAGTSFRLRRPTPRERTTLMPLWDTVCGVAGVHGYRYTLWIHNSADINALAAGGHVVAVTTAALELPAPQLEAVLAHELGHHLSGHPIAALLAWWYARPARFATWLIAWGVRGILLIGRTFRRFGNGYVALASVVAAALLFLVAFIMNPWLILLPAVAPLLALLSRQGELRADRIAAELGYGRPLTAVLQRWVREGHDQARARASRRARLLATHPSCGERIRELEGYLGPNLTL